MNCTACKTDPVQKNNMDLIAIGTCSKPIGTHGEIRIAPLTDDVNRFQLLHSLWIGKNESTAAVFEVESMRVEPQRVVVRLREIGSVEEAEKLRNAFVFVPREESASPKTGSYFIHDILACEVATEEQTVVGKVVDVLSLPAQDVWVVQNGTKKFYLPAVKAIIRNVDVQKKRITIQALEGLIE